MAILKAVILGDTECGKTSFTQRYTTGNFPDPNFLRTTIGASFDTKNVTTQSGKAVTLSIWDFGGQQRFIDHLKGMIRGAQIGLLFFDVSRLQTLDNLENYWIPAIEENSTLSIKDGDGERFLLVANKVDLIDAEKIDFIAGEVAHFLQTYRLQTYFISARTGVGIQGLDQDFMKIVDRFLPEQ
ncbi:MAG: Rab family GTPase [Candidatus Thorarchaeota archaeon]|jgi:small GTP-binding protein